MKQPTNSPNGDMSEKIERLYAGAGAPSADTRPVTVPRLAILKKSGQKILVLTAYDYPTARIVDEAGFDVVLVGDSLGNVVLGYDDTLQVTVDDVLHHLKAVRRGLKRALLVADMPFGSFQSGTEDAIRNATRMVKEGGAQAVKIEGGAARAHLVSALVAADIPVMGHVGLLPQAVHAKGGYRVQGRTPESARQLLADALALEQAGAFSVVLEGVPAEVATRITEALSIPTIGIGAGAGCDGQVLVFHDAVGWTFDALPKFVRQYGEMTAHLQDALRSLASDVREGEFPNEAESYASEPLPEDWHR